MKSLLPVLLALLCGRAAFAQPADSLPSTLSLGYEHYRFDRQFPDNWQIGQLEYKRQTGAGAFLGRLQYADRLGRNGWQAEAEAYPVLSKKVYGYVGLGYSPSVPVFPEWRSGASVFVALPGGWEAEGGFRYLRFDRNIWIGTAGLSKYAGRWLLNLRSFVGTKTPASDYAVFFTARRYFRNERDHLWLQLGSDISPDESRNVLYDTSAVLSSRRLTVGSRLSLSPRYDLAASLGWVRDELGAGSTGNQWVSSLQLSYRFR